jgi:hypothetical protein
MMYVYTSMYIYIYVCMHIPVYLFMHVYILFIYLYVHTYVRTCVWQITLFKLSSFITQYTAIIIIIVIIDYFLWICSPARAMASSFTRFFDHIHNDAPQSVGLLWTNDQLHAEAST